MTHECDYCGRHPSACGELRMMVDALRGSACFPTCHDCYDDGLGCSGEVCGWLTLQTVDEWAPDLSLLREATWDNFAHALSDRRAGL